MLGGSRHARVSREYRAAGMADLAVGAYRRAAVARGAEVLDVAGVAVLVEREPQRRWLAGGSVVWQAMHWAWVWQTAQVLRFASAARP